MDEKKKNSKRIWLDIFNNFEVYIGTVTFFLIMILLFVQVVSRYVFHHAFTWTEELAVSMYVLMVFCGISGAVTYRKHLRIDALLNAVPFVPKKVLMILDDIVFIIFNEYATYYYVTVLIPNLRKSSTTLLHIPKRYLYAIIPVFLTLTSIRLVVNIMKTWKETPKTIGTSEPVIDIEALEAEAKANKKAQQDKEVKQ
jgi:TRAP-type C4-dicarboxylate transport system permease small subunit